MSLTSRVTKTGPVGATLTPMTVDMIGPAGCFGRLDLPEIKTSSKGATVQIDDQKITITDLDAFLAFVRAIQCNDQVALDLDNGVGKIKSWGLSGSIVYKKRVDIAGMRGPATEIVKTEILPDGGFSNTLRTRNPSPLEIDLGVATFDIVNGEGEVLGWHKGRLHLPRGESTYTMIGKATRKGDVSDIKLVGKDVEADAWSKKSIAFYDLPVTLTPQLTEVLKA